MKKALLLAALLAIVWYVNRPPDEQPYEQPAESAFKSDAIAEAYANQANDVQVAGEGTVSRLLPDDEEGGRHQRFILRLDSGQTLLIAHNIDLAPRIDSLGVGDTVAFNGVYEWNDRGGVIHWTHHDPQGEHEAGWLRHRGRIYQ
jgi:hypothetical protein